MLFLVFNFDQVFLKYLGLRILPLLKARLHRRFLMRYLLQFFLHVVAALYRARGNKGDFDANSMHLFHSKFNTIFANFETRSF